MPARDDGPARGEGRRAVTLNRVSSWTAKRILIDSMIIDLIAATPGLVERIQRAAANGALVIIETHILRDQLSNTADPERRRLLLQVYDALPKRAVETRGIVLDVSRFDEAEFCDSDVAGLATGGRGGMHDALLASTALAKADVLVTEDTTLRKKVKKLQPGCEVWTWADFRRFVEDRC